MEIRKRYGKLAGSQVSYTDHYNLKYSKNIVGQKRDPPGRPATARRKRAGIGEHAAGDEREGRGPVDATRIEERRRPSSSSQFTFCTFQFAFSFPVS
jgi:hypothetical protein